MGTEEMKKCPYCGEMIKKEANKCRYCRSNLAKKNVNFDFLSTPGYWHRTREGKKIAGVCTGLARQFDAPVLILPLRLFFILTTFFYGFGLVLYLVLWLLMPRPTDKPGEGENNNCRADDKEEKPEMRCEKNDVGLILSSVLFAIGILLLVRFYLFTVRNVIGIALHPSLLWFMFIAVGALALGTFIVIYFIGSNSPWLRGVEHSSLS